MGSPGLRPVRRVDRDLEAIGAVTQAVLDGDDLEEVLARIASEARALVGARSGVVVTVSADSGTMVFRAVDGLVVGPLRVGHSMPVRDTLTALALEQASPIVARSPAEIPDAGRSFATATGIGPLIAAPMRLIGSARGVLVVGREVDASPYRPADVALVTAFAAQAANAIELFELRAAETDAAARTERKRIARDLHERVLGTLLDLEDGVRGIGDGMANPRLTAGIDAAVAQLRDAAGAVRAYVAELGAEPERDPAAVAVIGHASMPTSSDDRPRPGPGAVPSSRPGWRRDRDQATISIIGELAEALSSDDEESGLQGLVDSVAERVGADGGLIATLTADGQHILVRARFGPDLEERRVGEVLALSETAVGEAILTGRTQIWTSLADAPSSTISGAVKSTVGPLVAVPLAIRGQRFGTFAVARVVGSAPFTTRQARLIEAYAVQAAISLEFERVRHEVRLGSVSAERDRIGRDLHERVIQLLFGVAFALQALDAAISDDQTRATLQAIVDATDRAIRDLRRVVFGLGPGPTVEPSVDPRLAALAADNARLQAEIEAQLEEVRASRSRIVAAGDAERKRVERDLHDGAQQRLVALTLALRLARSRLGDDVDPSARLSLDHATAEAKAALSELRELARGIHPQILTEAGLPAALESLAARAGITVTLDVEVARLAPAVEGAAYFLVSEALANVAKHAAASRVDVRARWADDELRIEIIDDGIGGADTTLGSGLRGLADRLSSLDGTLEIVSPVGEGTTLRARIPRAATLEPAATST